MANRADPSTAEGQTPVGAGQSDKPSSGRWLRLVFAVSLGVVLAAGVLIWTNKGRSGEWHFLTGTQDEIQQVTSDYNIFYELVPEEGDTPRSFKHLAQILLIDQGGDVRGAFLGGTSEGGDVIPPAFLADKISTLLTGVGEPLDSFGPASGFELTNQNGKRVKLSDFQGRVVVMTFFYTTCPVNFCPLLNTNLMQARDSLDKPLREKVVLLSITFDPEVDTPAVLKKYAKERGFN